MQCAYEHRARFYVHHMPSFVNNQNYIFKTRELCKDIKEPLRDKYMQKIEDGFGKRIEKD